MKASLHAAQAYIMICLVLIPEHQQELHLHLSVELSRQGPNALQ